MMSESAHFINVRFSSDVPSIHTEGREGSEGGKEGREERRDNMLENIWME